MSDRRVASCVDNLSTGVFRLEVPWDEDRRILVNALDQGSKGWPSKLDLYYRGDVRGARAFRPPRIVGLGTSSWRLRALVVLS